jgi:hypothetical protein
MVTQVGVPMAVLFHSQKYTLQFAFEPVGHRGAQLCHLALGTILA